MTQPPANVAAVWKALQRLERSLGYTKKAMQAMHDVLGEVHLEYAVGASNLLEGMTLAELEEIAIRNALRRHNGNRTKAAKALGTSERTLYRRIATLHIETPRWKSS